MTLQFSLSTVLMVGGVLSLPSTAEADDYQFIGGYPCENVCQTISRSCAYSAVPVRRPIFSAYCYPYSCSYPTTGANYLHAPLRAHCGHFSSWRARANILADPHCRLLHPYCWYPCAPARGRASPSTPPTSRRSPDPDARRFGPARIPDAYRHLFKEGDIAEIRDKLRVRWENAKQEVETARVRAARAKAEYDDAAASRSRAHAAYRRSVATYESVKSTNRRQIRRFKDGRTRQINEAERIINSALEKAGASERVKLSFTEFRNILPAESHVMFVGFWRDVVEANPAVSKVAEVVRPAIEPIAEQVDEATEKIEYLQQGINTALKDASDRFDEYGAADRATLYLRDKWQDAERWLLDRRDELARSLADLVNTEIMFYDITMEVGIAINFHTGTCNITMAFDYAGVNWDSAKTEQLLSGNYVFPKVDPFQMAVESFGLHVMQKDGYDEFATKSKIRPSGGTYVASEEFVRWAKWETVGEGIVKSLVGLGDEPLNEMKLRLKTELRSILSWINLQSQPIADSVLTELFVAAYEGRSPKLPEFEIRRHDVPYTYEISVRGASYLPDRLLNEARGRFRVTDSSLPESEIKPPPHVGFIIAWTPPTSTSLERLLKSFDANTINYDQSSIDVEPELLDRFANVVPNPTLRDMLAALAKGEGEPMQLAKAHLRRLFGNAGVTYEELQSYWDGRTRMIDLTDSTVSERIASFLKKRIAQGNKREVHIERMEFDIATLTLTGKLRLRHRHSWGSARQLLDRTSPRGKFEFEGGPAAESDRAVVPAERTF